MPVADPPAGRSRVRPEDTLEEVGLSAGHLTLLPFSHHQSFPKGHGDLCDFCLAS